jgi:hypothetical protein
MIIETSDNRFYRVVDTGQPGLDHCYFGIPMKRQGHEWAMTASGIRAYKNGRPELIRKAATRIVEA